MSKSVPTVSKAPTVQELKTSQEAQLTAQQQQQLYTLRMQMRATAITWATNLNQGKSTSAEKTLELAAQLYKGLNENTLWD